MNDFLDAGLEAGAERIESVEFASSRAEQLRAEAKRKAVDDARSRAADMARAFGAELGEVYSIGSVNSRFASQYAATMLDRVEVTGTRMREGQYLQPTVEYGESIDAVFELMR